MLRQVAAAKTLLAVAADRPGGTKISQAERGRLQALFRCSRLSATELAVVAAEVKLAGFAAADCDALVDTILDMASDGAPAFALASVAGRVPLQNFESMGNYLPQSMWDRAAAGDLTAFVDHLARLGLRNPTESSSQTAALLFLLSTEGAEKTRAMEQAARLATIAVFKKAMKGAAQGAQAPAELVFQLPRDPLVSRRSFPALRVQFPRHRLRARFPKRCLRTSRGPLAFAAVVVARHPRSSQALPKAPFCNKWWALATRCCNT